MMELPIEYVNKLANQMQLISTLLGGFSLGALVTLLDKDLNQRLYKAIFRSAVVAVGAFLVAIFATTGMILLTTEGFPFPVDQQELFLLRTSGGISLLIGIMAIAILISLSGWTKSRALGWFSSVVGLITILVIIFLMG